nr:transcriptional regulator ATRX homolog isoform X2 [Ipomoea batatas]
MKFSSNSSSSGGGAGNADASKNGCIAGMFRRLLCSNALPTHPADHMSSVSTHPSSDHAIQRRKSEEGKKIESLASTGVVARLMGLESMPRVELNPNKAIARSQSMSSMDSLRELKSTKEKNLRACSFREIPTYLELEDENFFILSFEYGGKTAELRPKQRRSEKVKNSCRRRESVHQKNKENLDINQVSVEENQKGSEIITGSDGKLQDSTNILRPTRKDKIEADCDSEKSSPNSVLGFVEFPAIQDIPNSEKFWKLASSKSRRTLSEELENYRKLKLISDDFQPKRSEKVYGAAARKNWCSKDENDVKLWGEICRLADAQTLQTKWQHEEIWKQEKVCQEIGGSFEFEIVDELIGEMVDQLIIDSHIASLCNLT